MPWKTTICQDSRTEHRRVRRVLQQSPIPREPGQPNPGRRLSRQLFGALLTVEAMARSDFSGFAAAGSDMDGFDQRRGHVCPTGAGIIADLDPAFEQGEYINKAKALFDVADESQTLRQRRWARAIAI